MQIGEAYYEDFIFNKDLYRILYLMENNKELNPNSLLGRSTLLTWVLDNLERNNNLNTVL